jgi:hypothetical protein
VAIGEFPSELPLKSAPFQPDSYSVGRQGSMTVSESQAPMTLGFLTVVHHEVHGYFGGYLLLNANGRPLEFHCTAPLKPNRAQEILYGPTLEPYLYGEQIGQTLIAKSKAKPQAVCTDLAAVLAAREFVSLPIALVEGCTEPPTPEKPARDVRMDAAHGPAVLKSFVLGRNRLAVSSRHPQDQAELANRLAEVVEHVDLLEPFDRIRAAIEEAQRTSR